MLLCMIQSSVRYPLPSTLPALLQCCCTPIAQYTTPLPTPLLYAHTPYNIGNGNIVYRPSGAVAHTTHARLRDSVVSSRCHTYIPIHRRWIPLPLITFSDQWYGPQSFTQRTWVRLPVLSHSHRRVLTHSLSVCLQDSKNARELSRILADAGQEVPERLSSIAGKGFGGRSHHGGRNSNSKKSWGNINDGWDNECG